MKKKIFMGVFVFSMAGSLALQKPCISISADTYQDGYTDVLSDFDLGEEEYEGVGHEIENGEDETGNEYADDEYPIGGVEDVIDPDDEIGDGEYPNDPEIDPVSSGDNGPDVDVIVTTDDIKVTPTSRKIHIGSSFQIGIVQANPDDWEEYDEDVWEDAYESSIGSVEFKSKKSYIAKVNANGVVKGKHKGTTTIVTTIYFNDGIKMLRKTKVKVKK